MNLFRSEEHVRNWSGFKPDSEDGIMALPDMAKLFSGSHMTRRPDPDYISQGKYSGEFVEDLAGISESHFWAP